MEEHQIEFRLSWANADIESPTSKRHAEKCGVDDVAARDWARRELEAAGIDWRKPNEQSVQSD